jgi:hypothetical protein
MSEPFHAAVLAIASVICMLVEISGNFVADAGKNQPWKNWTTGKRVSILSLLALSRDLIPLNSTPQTPFTNTD